MKYVGISGIFGGRLNQLLTQLFAAIGINTISSATSISSFPGNDFDTLYVSDTNRGGQFVKYVGADSADNGMIFTDAQGNKWLRVTYDNRINVRWYGAKSDSVGTPFDSLAAFTAAIAYIESHPEFDTLFIPYDSSGYGYYKLSATITVNHQIRIIGEGAGHYPKTKIRVPSHTTGFIFEPEEVDSNTEFSVEVENIHLVCGVDGAYDESKHGIITRVASNFKNIHLEQFDGDGVHISASLTNENNNYGNASLSKMDNVTTSYCRNGIFTEGADANSILYINCNPSQNRRWGIREGSLLGGCIIKPHFAFNGAAIPGAKTVVSYEGILYAALPGHDGYYGDSGTNINRQPNLNVGTYWQVVQEPMEEMGAWSAVETYYSGGAACAYGANNWTNFLHPYTEAFQPPIWLSNRSKVDGGDNGAGVTGGAFWNMYSGEQQLYNAGLLLQKYLHIGTLVYDAAAQAKIYNDYAVTSTRLGLKSEGSTADFHNQIKNTATTLNYGLSNSDNQTLIGGVLMSVLNASGFDIVAGDRLRIRNAKTPASAAAAGNAGEFCWDSSYLYICTSNATWRRIAHSSW